eukprot:c3850_g1_i1 orf=104-337(+)
MFLIRIKKLFKEEKEDVIVCSTQYYSFSVIFLFRVLFRGCACSLEFVQYLVFAELLETVCLGISSWKLENFFEFFCI